MIKKLILACLVAMIGLGCAAKKDSDMAKIYDFKTTGNKGAEVTAAL